MNSTALLAADVGGTKTDIAFGRIVSGGLDIAVRQRYSSADYATFDALLDDFERRLVAAGYGLEGSAACLAIAGPVRGNEAHLTNLPWQISTAPLYARRGVRAACIVNDFEAVGHGLVHLASDELLSLQQAERDPHAPCLAIGAGTGLGVAWITREDGGYRVHPTEAGHLDFAPVDALQDELLSSMRHEFGHVSYERILSGNGLARIFQFLMECGHGVPSSALESALKREEDSASVISALGLEGSDLLAVRALDIFVQVYGAFAGNMALATLPRGGVYVAGGIAPRIASKLQDGQFMNSFLAKGRFRDLLADLPVDVVMNPAVGLYGAFEIASRLGGELATVQ